MHPKIGYLKKLTLGGKTMSARLSIVDYIHKLKNVGFTDSQAEVQAKQLEHIRAEIKKDLKQEIKNEINVKDLATKADIKQLEAATKADISKLALEIEKSKNQMLIWMGAFAVFIFGVMAKGFHWV
jgi:multidrug efflux pump subunit AcrB